MRLQPILDHYRGLRLPPEVQKLQRWLDNIRQHPAIQATQRHPEGDQKYDQELMHHYSKYAGEPDECTSVAVLQLEGAAYQCAPCLLDCR